MIVLLISIYCLGKYVLVLGMQVAGGLKAGTDTHRGWMKKSKQAQNLAISKKSTILIRLS